MTRTTIEDVEAATGTELETSSRLDYMLCQYADLERRHIVAKRRIRELEGAVAGIVEVMRDSDPNEGFVTQLINAATDLLEALEQPATPAKTQ